MTNPLNAFARFWRDENGAAAIEYALVAELISVAMIAGAAKLGVNAGGLQTRLAGCVVNPVAECASGGG